MPSVSASFSPLSDEQAGDIYSQLLTRYRAAGPVDVDFRALISGVSATERLTHQLHPYPAKLLRHIPALFASAPQVVRSEGTVVDPFCGSGTVLVEAQAAGRRAIGLDTNPIAQLLARVKTTCLPQAPLEEMLAGLVQRASSSGARRAEVPARLKFWFPPHAFDALRALRAAIDALGPSDSQDFFYASFSATARTVSYADPRVAVPVRLRPDQYAPGHWLRTKTSDRLRLIHETDIFAIFEGTCRKNFDRIARIEAGAPPALVLAGDARDLENVRVAGRALADVESVLTSPPYLGAQKYIRASSLSLMWLGHAPLGKFQDLTRTSVGREHFRAEEYRQPALSGLPHADDIIARVRQTNPMRAHLAATYVNEMRQVITGIHSILRPGGSLVLVAGPNRLCGEPFDTPGLLQTLAEQSGLTVELSLIDTIRSRGLMTRRNRSASVITQETVTVFRKAVING